MITPPPGVRTPDRRSGFPVPLPVAPTACGNGKWEAAFVDGRLAPRRSLHPAVPLASHSLVRPRGAFFRPGRLIQKPARTAAVKTGPVQGRRRLGLDGREHDGTLARHGYGRSQVPSMTLDRRAQKPIRLCVPAYQRSIQVYGTSSADGFVSSNGTFAIRVGTCVFPVRLPLMGSRCVPCEMSRSKFLFG